MSGWRARVVSWPDLLCVAVAAASLPIMLLLLLGAFHPWLVIPAGVLAAALCWALVGAEPGEPARHAVPATAVALGLAALWALVNAQLSSQDIVVARDPAIYATTAQWLAHHASLPIPTAAHLFPGVPGLTEPSLGYHAVAGGGAVDAQGNHLVVAWVALVGAVLGSGALLKANCLLGALALVAFFGLLRRVVGAVWALVGMSVLAVSLPMLHFSRSPYTEPFTLAMVVGGLSLLWRAQGSGRTRDWAAAGLVLGTSAMSRVDGSVTLMFLPVLAALVLLIAPRESWRTSVRQVLVLLAGVAGPTVVGLVDLYQLAPGYAHDLSADLGLVQKGLLALVVVAVVAVAVDWRLRLLDRALSVPRLPAVGAGLVLAYAALLASRPLWRVDHHFGPAGNPNVGQLQAALRLPVDPTRSYDEHTVNWLAWYYGWPLLVLAALGLALMTYRCLARRDLLLAPALLLLASVGSLYLWRASIVPDQIWAVRRLLPVVIPLLILAAVYLLSALAGGRAGSRALAAALAVTVLAGPIVVTRPLLTAREYVPQLAQVRSVCDALPDRAAVLLLDGAAQQEYATTLRAYCLVDVVGLNRATKAVLATARAAAARSGHSAWVVATSPTAIPGATATAPGFVAQLTKWPERLTEAPRTTVSFTTTLYVGQVGVDGSVTVSAP